MNLEAFLQRLGAQRDRLRAVVGERRADLVQFSFLCLLLLPWYCLLVLPQSAQGFGLLAAPAFVIGWLGAGLAGTGSNRRQDRFLLGLASVCALVSFAAFAMAVLNRPRAPAPEVWTPPAEGVLETEVLRPR